jgi:hypothetical protein
MTKSPISGKKSTRENEKKKQGEEINVKRIRKIIIKAQITVKGLGGLIISPHFSKVRTSVHDCVIRTFDLKNVHISIIM